MSPLPRFQILKLKKECLLYVCKHCVCMHACMCTINIPGAGRGQRRASNPVEPELQMGVCVHVCVAGPLPTSPAQSQASVDTHFS